MTKTPALKNFTFAVLFLSLAGTRPGYANANRIALNCQEQQLTGSQYFAKWDRALEKVILHTTEEEDSPPGTFSLLIDFKRNQAMYSETGAWKIMNIIAKNSNKINLYFEKESELGFDLTYIELDKRALSFELKQIYSWNDTAIFKSKGKCQSVQESEIIYQYQPFPPID